MTDLGAKFFGISIHMTDGAGESEILLGLPSKINLSMATIVFLIVSGVGQQNKLIDRIKLLLWQFLITAIKSHSN